MFCDKVTPFLEDSEILSWWLGSSIDIGLAITAKMLKCNGEVVHCLTLYKLTQAELESEEGKETRRLYNEVIHQRLSDPLTDKDFTNISDTEILVHDFYGDNDLKQ